MSKVVFAIPSKRPPSECQPLLDRWLAMGYRVVLRRLNTDAPHPTGCDLVLRDSYVGWAASVNELSSIILKEDPSVDWIVTGGDDYFPDPVKRAGEIAEECSVHFYNHIECMYPPDKPAWTDIPLGFPGGSGRNASSWKRWSTFGVMQPTGDRWGENDPTSRRMFPNAPALIDRICGSPWMGREFCERMYGGTGPMWGGYPHMYADEELQTVAQSLGALWQRRDLKQEHRHWSRGPQEGIVRDTSACPDWLRWANTRQHWDAAREMFQTRKATGFPGHAPL